MQASDVDWGWVESYDLGFCLAFARGVSEEGMLAAYGAEPGAARVLTREQMLADEAYEDWWTTSTATPWCGWAASASGPSVSKS